MSPPRPIDFSKEKWGPVFIWPSDVKPVVLDLSGTSAVPSSVWNIGKYDEKRGIYAEHKDLFTEERCIHVGIDLGGPVGTPVYLPYEGRIAFQGYNPLKGDYGYCVITRHVIQRRTLWLLFGHLDAKSVSHPTDQVLPVGHIIGWLGNESENGGWPSHVHFQLSYREPRTHDLPGVVTEAERVKALGEFPDPRNILGPIY